MEEISFAIIMVGIPDHDLMIIIMVEIPGHDLIIIIPSLDQIMLRMD